MARLPGIVPDGPLTDGTVLLRLPEESDGAAVCSYGENPDIEETGWLPVPVPCSHDVAAQTIQEFQRGWHGPYGLTWVITTPPATDLRGVVHLSVQTSGVGEIAYGIAPQYRCRGLATRAVQLIMAWAFTQLALTRLEIIITAGGINGLASQRVAEKAGFVSAGMRRSHVAATGLAYEDPLYAVLAPGPAA